MALSDVMIAEIKAFIQAEDWETAIMRLKVLHPHDIAEMLHELEPESKYNTLARLDNQLLTEVLPELSDEEQLGFLNYARASRVAELLGETPSDETADFLGKLSPDVQEILLARLSEEKAKEARQLLRYPEDSAGGLMTTEFVAIPMDFTAQEAIDEIREKAREVETIYYIYVTDHEGKLAGVVSMRDLVLAPAYQKISEFMTTEVFKTNVHMDQQQVAQTISNYDLLAVPVVDEHNHLLGIITVDDIIDVIEEEATEDISYMAGTSEKVDALLEAPKVSVAKARLPWLITCFVVELVTGSIIALFRNTLASIIMLAAFIPVVAASGYGGVQSSTVFIRGLATGEIKYPWRHLLREISIGCLVGLACGVSLGFVAFLWLGKPVLGFIVGAAIFAAVSLANVNGVAIAMFFNKIGLDPAIAAGPLISTVQDIISVLIYLGLATSMLHLIPK